MSKENYNDLIKQIKVNSKKIEDLKARNKAMRESLNSEIRSDKKEKNEILSNPKNSIKNVKSLDISYYYEYLKCSESVQDLEIFMPQLNSPEFEDVYASLMLAMQRKVIIINEKIKLTKFGDELNDLKDELLKIKEMMGLVRKYKESLIYLESEEIPQNIEKDSPTLVYSKTAAGNAVLLKNLKREAVESYDDFLTLYESLESGKLKNPKCLVSGVFKEQLCEVRYNNVRMFFLPLGNVYLVAGALVKKYRSSKYYENFLMSIYKTASLNKKEIIDNLENKTFIDAENMISDEIKKLLKKEK